MTTRSTSSWRALCCRLTADGFEVEIAADAEQALARISTSRPDLVLMDIQMPGTDGLALTQRLKLDPATQGIVVVAFTAYAMKGDEARLRAAGCDGYIAKPIQVASFAATVRALLQQAAAAVGPGLADPAPTQAEPKA